MSLPRVVRSLTRLRVVRSVRAYAAASYSPRAHAYAADSYSSCRDVAQRCGWRLPDLTRLDAALWTCMPPHKRSRFAALSVAILA